MKNEDLTNEADDAARAAFGRLSEEAPSEEQWQQMKGRMAKEGLIAGKSKRPGLIILFSLLIVGTISTTIYFLNNTQPLHPKETGIVSISGTTSTTTTTANAEKTAPSHQSMTNENKTKKTIAKSIPDENKSTLTAAIPTKTFASENKPLSLVSEKKISNSHLNSKEYAMASKSLASKAHRNPSPVVDAALITEKTPSVVENKEEKTSSQNAEPEQELNKSMAEKSESALNKDNQQEQPSSPTSTE